MSLPVDGRRPESKDPSHPSITGRTFLSLLAGLVLLLLVGCAGWWQVGAWLAQRRAPASSPQPIFVLSESMAPALCGPAWEVDCDDCGFPFQFAAIRQTFPDTDVVCPNCGKTQGSESLATSASHGISRQHVNLFQIRDHEPIERGALVAVRIQDDSIDDTERYFVKRALGLPGETIGIRNGDVFANSQRLKKTWSELRSVGIVVHDDAFQTAEGTRGSHWEATKVTNPLLTHPMHWVEYVHSPALPRPFERGTPSPIKDNYGFNQHISRSLNDVSDFWVEFQWKPDLNGQTSSLWLNLQHDQGDFLCGISGTDDSVTLMMGEETRTFGLKNIKSNSTAAKIEWGFWDGQIGLAINGQAVFVESVDANIRSNRITGNERPLSIGIEFNDELECRRSFERKRPLAISGLRVLRDIYYTCPTRQPWRFRQLAFDEYLLLGDNSPVSIDARQGEEYGVVQRSSIFGRVKKRQ